MTLPDSRRKGTDRECLNTYIELRENETWYLDISARE
jgi:hypothetical protein